MTTRNFRVNNGLEVGSVTVTASSNAVAGVSSITLDNTTAPGADAVLSNKKYVQKIKIISNLHPPGAFIQILYEKI